MPGSSVRPEGLEEEVTEDPCEPLEQPQQQLLAGGHAVQRGAIQDYHLETAVQLCSLLCALWNV